MDDEGGEELGMVTLTLLNHVRYITGLVMGNLKNVFGMFSNIKSMGYTKPRWPN